MTSFLPLFLAAQSMFVNVPPAAPAGTALHVRLMSAVGTYASRTHSSVEAVLIAPVKAGETTILPVGSVLTGEITSVQRVGLGILHETASMQLSFQSVAVPGGEETPLPARLSAVDNARETVTARGAIQRWRSTGSLANRAALYIRKLILLDVHAQLVVWAIRAVIVQVPEPEIYLPTGTELTLNLTAPLSAMPEVTQSDEPRGLTENELRDLAPVIAALPERTAAKSSERPSDQINLLFVGSRTQVESAFIAAGWIEPRPISARSNFANVWAAVRDTPYPEQPMSSLLLNDAPADVSWQKGFNDASKRHHIRMWEQPMTWNGEQVWAAAATRDVDYGYFHGGKAMTHKVARYVDQERDKVAADVAFANCADTMDLVDRPDIARRFTNATGDIMETDGKLMVVHLNDCDSPHRVGSVLDQDTLPEHGGLLQRVLRRQIICLRSDFLHSNIYWRSYEGARLIFMAIRKRHQVVDPDAAAQDTLASRLFPDKLNTVISYR
jgi:hypothetical protein